MKKGIELIVIPIIAFIILTKPRSLVNFSRTMLGKVAMVLLVIGAASRNQVYGLIAATAMVLILENKYEGMAVSDTDAVDNEVPVVDKQEVALEEEEVAGEEAEDEAEDEAEHVDGECNVRADRVSARACDILALFTEEKMLQYKAWRCLVEILVLLQPSSAAAERVFSLLTTLFSKAQRSTLQKFIFTSIAQRMHDRWR